MNSAEAQKLARQNWRKTLESGAFNVLSGPRNPRWKGGKEGWRERFIATGILAKRVREYRQRNKDKVREFAEKRSGRKLGRLPRGTVSKIGQAQRWRCAICKIGIKEKFHVDHIMPLALGGEHKPTNIQLLCPTCNVRKSAKHPVDYMQQMGFLL